MCVLLRIRHQSWWHISFQILSSLDPNPLWLADEVTRAYAQVCLRPSSDRNDWSATSWILNFQADRRSSSLFLWSMFWASGAISCPFIWSLQVFPVTFLHSSCPAPSVCILLLLQLPWRSSCCRVVMRPNSASPFWMSRMIRCPSRHCRHATCILSLPYIWFPVQYSSTCRSFSSARLAIFIWLLSSHRRFSLHSLLWTRWW